MKQPKSKLPWKISIPDLDYKGEADVHDGTYIIHNSTSENPWDGILLSDRMYYNSAPESREDAEYIVEACNNYPKAIELLQKINKHEGSKEDYFKLMDDIKEFLEKDV